MLDQLAQDRETKRGMSSSNPVSALCLSQAAESTTV